MAQNYTLMARKNLLKPDETPKYYAVARSGRKVTVKEAVSYTHLTLPTIA